MRGTGIQLRARPALESRHLDADAPNPSVDAASTRAWAWILAELVASSLTLIDNTLLVCDRAGRQSQLRTVAHIHMQRSTWPLPSQLQSMSFQLQTINHHSPDACFGSRTRRHSHHMIGCVVKMRTQNGLGEARRNGVSANSASISTGRKDISVVADKFGNHSESASLVT